MTNKGYFPNNWDSYKRIPSKRLEPVEFDEFMEWKVHGWELPLNVLCIIREDDNETGKIKEYVYKMEHAAKKKAREIKAAGNRFTICTANNIIQQTPLEEDIDYDEY